MSEHPYRDTVQVNNPRFLFLEDLFVDLEQVCSCELITNEDHSNAGDWCVRFRGDSEDIYFDPESGAQLFNALKEYRR